MSSKNKKIDVLIIFILTLIVISSIITIKREKQDLIDNNTITFFINYEDCENITKIAIVQSKETMEIIEFIESSEIVPITSSNNELVLITSEGWKDFSPKNKDTIKIHCSDLDKGI